MPLIGQHDYKPYLYYCKDYDIMVPSLEKYKRTSYKDLEYHKVKLLELIQGEQLDKYEYKNGQYIDIIS